MPLYKFGRNDVFNNQIKTHPKNELHIYEQCVIHNNQPNLSNAFADVNYSDDAEATLKHVPCGYTSLYELNVDRTANADASAVIGVSSSISASQNVPDTGFIYPFVHNFYFSVLTVSIFESLF